MTVVLPAPPPLSLNGSFIMQRSTLWLGALVLVAAILVIVGRPETAPPAPAGITDGAPLPAGHPALDGTAAAPATPAGPMVTVLETLESAGYTYARVQAVGETGEESEMWAAGPVTPLEVGQQVSLDGAMGMQNFRAASLDRTFDEILFVNRYGTGVAASAPGAASGVAPGVAMTAEAPPIDGGRVLDVSQGPGYTYVLVEDGDVQLWVAGTQLEVEVGQMVTWDGGAIMRDFESPTLERTFDRLLFADGLRIRN